MKPTPQQLIEDVAERYGVTPDDILSKKRTQTVADARALVCYFLLKHLHMSSTEVGNAINRNKAKREQPPKKEKPKFGMSSEQMKKLIEERRQREENANPKQVCKNCVKYPCFPGMDNLSSNFALTCKRWRMKS